MVVRNLGIQIRKLFYKEAGDFDLLRFEEDRASRLAHSFFYTKQRNPEQTNAARTSRREAISAKSAFNDRVVKASFGFPPSLLAPESQSPGTDHGLAFLTITRYLEITQRFNGYTKPPRTVKAKLGQFVVKVPLLAF